MFVIVQGKYTAVVLSVQPSSPQRVRVWSERVAESGRTSSNTSTTSAWVRGGEEEKKPH